MDEKQSCILGIDTGGTFTDGVILSGEDRKILAKAKAPTTRQDLAIGIGECIRLLGQAAEKPDIRLVCLSTTLATNAVVEGKRSRIGLITMYDGKMEEIWKADLQFRVEGHIGIYGNVLEPLAEDQVRQALEEMRGQVDALVVSGYFSVRNPIHENRIREMAQEVLGIPVVCAHELSFELGYPERTVTAVLNAHLLPVIDRLIRKTRQTLEENDIDANIAVIKGDGTMMDEKQALERPVETVLSGPAASVVGGAYLTGVSDALFVDLGGTTTDIADMSGGHVTVVEDGAVVGGWKTKVQAVDMRTFGLGGDSRLVEMDGSGQAAFGSPPAAGSGDFRFGPSRAIPFCFAALQYPHLTEELSVLEGPLYRRAERIPLLDGFHEAEGLMLNERAWEEMNAGGRSLGEGERQLLELLQDGPHTVVYLAERLQRRARFLNVKPLLQNGTLEVISVTPTDLLHAAGEYVEWDAEVSRKALGLLADRRGLGENEMLQRLRKLFSDQLTLAVIRSSFSFDGNEDPQVMESPWLKRALFDEGAGIQLSCRLKKPVVAVGAPAKAWLAPLAERLDTEVITPENHEVANAIGAAKGRISRKLQVTVRYDDLKHFSRILTPWGGFERLTMGDAVRCAMEMMEDWADRIGQETGINDYQRHWTEEKTWKDSRTRTRLQEDIITLELTAAPECFARK